MRKIALIGGDCRQIHAAATFQRAGFVPFVYGNDGASKAGFTAPYTLKETLEGAEAVLLPVPSVKKKGFLHAPHTEQPLSARALFDLLPREGTVFVWGRENCRIPDGYRTVDLAEDEILQNEYASITAQAALLIAMQASGRRLSDARCSVVGYGRIGKRLCRLAAAWGARVEVVTRQGSNRVLALGQGLTVKDPRSTALFSQSDLIFNTVPFPILDEKSFAQVPSHALYIELASRPGGIDPAFAAFLPIGFLSGAGLPGRICPESAGKALAQAVLLHLEVGAW